jgi:hypothetical protein
MRKIRGGSLPTVLSFGGCADKIKMPAEPIVVQHCYYAVEAGIVGKAEFVLRWRVVFRL